MYLNEASDTLTRMGRDLHAQRANRTLLEEQREQITGEIRKREREAELLQRASVLLGTVGDARQDAVRAQVEALVTKGLQTVFDQSLSFHLRTSTRANASMVDLVVRTTFPDGTTLDTPVVDARGGGVAAVVGFLLRTVMLLLTPNVRRLLVLDETFAHVSADYEPRVAEFLRELVDKAEVQVVLVTHSDSFSDLADTVYTFRQGTDGKTVVTSAG